MSEWKLEYMATPTYAGTMGQVGRSKFPGVARLDYEDGLIKAAYYPTFEQAEAARNDRADSMENDRFLYRITEVPGEVVEVPPTLGCEPAVAVDVMEAAAARHFAKITAKNTSAVFQVDAPRLPPNPKQIFGDKKPQLQLVPPVITSAAALAFTDGGLVKGYGPYNWRESAVEAMTYVAAIRRHLDAYLDGEDTDPDSNTGAHHLGAIIAGAGILLDALAMGNLIDNRPPKNPGAAALTRKPTRIVKETP